LQSHWTKTESFVNIEIIIFKNLPYNKTKETEFLQGGLFDRGDNYFVLTFYLNVNFNKFLSKSQAV